MKDCHVTSRKVKQCGHWIQRFRKWGPVKMCALRHLLLYRQEERWSADHSQTPWCSSPLIVLLPLLSYTAAAASSWSISVWVFMAMETPQFLALPPPWSARLWATFLTLSGALHLVLPLPALSSPIAPPRLPLQRFTGTPSPPPQMASWVLRLYPM